MSSGEVIVSAPGSLMLMGEHAVLHDRRALVAAINRRIRVRLTPRADRKICIRSALGRLDTALDRLAIKQPFTFVTAALLQQRPHLRGGLNLEIQSEFSHEIGFGSSAAVTVALLRALAELNRTSRANKKILRDAVAVIRQVQGRGSGTDAAASLLGGIVCYRAEPLAFRSFAIAPPLAAVYCGYKTPTAGVIAQVEQHRRRQPQLFGKIFDLMDDCVARAWPLLRRKQWRALGEVMNIHHGLQTALGVNTPELEDICQRLRRASGSLGGAKISGSGLGDCAIALGRPRGNFKPYPLHQLQVEPTGVRLENETQAKQGLTPPNPLLQSS